MWKRSRNVENNSDPDVASVSPVKYEIEKGRLASILFAGKMLRFRMLCYGLNFCICMRSIVHWVPNTWSTLGVLGPGYHRPYSGKENITNNIPFAIKLKDHRSE